MQYVYLTKTHILIFRTIRALLKIGKKRAANQVRGWQETRIGPLPNRMFTGPPHKQKGDQLQRSPGKNKLKQKWDTTTHQAEWLR